MLNETEYVVFDVETTGLSPRWGDRIVEIAALKVRGNKPVDELCSFVDPERELSYGAFMVNGITPEMLAGAPRAGDVLSRFMDFAAGVPLVGHNIAFDMGFLEAELARAGMAPDSDAMTIDTLKMARGLLPNAGSYSLQNVARALEITVQQAHRAHADCLLTLEVFCRLADVACSQSIGDLQALSILFGNGGTAGISGESDKMIVIADAMSQKKDVQLTYFSFGRASATVRTVTPTELVSSGKRAKLIGFCHLRGAEREFRLDRILRVQTL